MGSLHVWGNMYDTASDNPVEAVLAVNRHPEAVLGYVGPARPDNRFVTFPQLVHHFHGHARCVSIATHPEYRAEFLDVEDGDATPDQAGPWIKERIKENWFKPGAYVNLSNEDAVRGSLDDEHIRISEVRLILAIRDTIEVALSYLRLPDYPAVQYETLGQCDVSVVRRDFWPAVS